MRKIFKAHSQVLLFLFGVSVSSPHDFHFSSSRPDSDILTRLVIKTSEENSHRYSPPPEFS
jgi:hypothetical protein